MYLLSDGKFYVMKNPEQPEKLMKTTSPVFAAEFSYKQARNLIQSKRAATKWIKNEGFQMISVESGTVVEPKYKSNAGVYIDENDIPLDEKLLEEINNEIDLILSLKTWNKNQLITYKNSLSANVDKYASAESDILHAIEKYKNDTGKNPQAHKMAKIYILLEEIRRKRRQVKKCLSYINVMIDAINNKYGIEKVKTELGNCNCDYKGRTEYYKKALELLHY